VRRVLASFPAEAARTWLESLGVELKLEPTGKYFPVSDDAQTVLDALLGACARAGVDVVCGARVVRIERAVAKEAPAGSAPPAVRPAQRWRLGIQRVSDSAMFGAGVAALGATKWPLPAVEPDEWREADAVILATGGLSFPRTGTDGTGYALATSLGHTLVPLVPALTPLTASDPLCASLQGMTLEVDLALRVGGTRVAATRGSFLFAHFGYSGPAALDLSRHWHRAEKEDDREVTANFLPGENEEGLTRAWIASATDARLHLRRFLSARLPDRLVLALCGEAKVAPSLPLSQVPRDRRATLFTRVVSRPMGVTGTLGYEKAEVTAGGVKLSEVDPSTLESRKAPGLYLCGEILDVEGRLGGFNFQWAWSSGTVAGRAASS
jgi:predicted flavoprotein YhiN